MACNNNTRTDLKNRTEHKKTTACPATQKFSH